MVEEWVNTEEAVTVEELWLGNDDLAYIIFTLHPDSDNTAAGAPRLSGLSLKEQIKLVLEDKFQWQRQQE